MADLLSVRRHLTARIDFVLSRARPRFQAEEAVDLVRRFYGLEARYVSELPSERDQNFHLRDSSGHGLVLKIANASEERSVLEFQNQALAHILSRDPEMLVPRLRLAANGEDICGIRDGNGSGFFVRLFDHLPGKTLASVRPQTDSLLRGVGRFMGRLDRALEGFSHQAVKRYLKWNVRNAHAIIADGIELVDSEDRRTILCRVSTLFDAEVAPRLDSLPRAIIHNDANDHNVLVSEEGEVAGILDFGDMVEGPIVCDVANAAAYAMLGKSEPLRAATGVVAGYHEARPLSEEELSVLHPLIATRLAMSVSISARQFSDEPDKEYLRISEKGAWEALFLLRDDPERLAHYRFRAACGLTPHTKAQAVVSFLDSHRAASVLPWDLRDEKLHVLDLSVGSRELGGLDVLEDVASFSRLVVDAMKRSRARVAVGRYDEARPIYVSPAFRPKTGEPRTVHLGIDLFVEEGTEIRAPLEGKVQSFAINNLPLDYGPTILLEHETGFGDRFYTLYGHLSPDSLDGLEKGRSIGRGEVIARVGRPPSNGNWPPHLHFQIVLDLLGKEGDFPGVAAPSERDLWLALSPNPARLLGLPDAVRAPRIDASLVAKKRREHLSGTLSISYERPLEIVRGLGTRLYDIEGRPYLDMVNNVCHVGHSHPRVVRALSEQASVLNTNTRYLHPHIVEYAERLAALLPVPLEVAFFVNSGSEANDLALRLARTHTRRKDTVVLAGAYHGNLTSLVEISPYKFDGPGGEGRSAHVHVLDLPDPFRGRYRRSDPDHGARYVEDARRLFASMASQGRPVGAFIAEAILSCAGQIVLPPGYLKEIYRLVREAGGIAIADEVQVGFGRVGARFWGFECEDAVPDIVTLGKPIGNGHPLGAVVTTREVARSFETGMEYFNTFGGNPVSCAVGLSVLDVIADEGLQENARIVGQHLLSGLRELSRSHAILGDVRGRGLFLGFEMIDDPETLRPAARQARYLVNRMKDEGVLLATDGPDGNVIKIKPPLVFSRPDAELFFDRLETVLGEDRLRV
jgi:4-aminobutyrate aminotransferase-like enzyme/Ser/Thr protein kinase RdoA (MazF antagonist)/murein DD-endopeptidase MepM/ murein hydrolase activator NlpD